MPRREGTSAANRTALAMESAVREGLFGDPISTSLPTRPRTTGSSTGIRNVRSNMRRGTSRLQLPIPVSCTARSKRSSRARGSLAPNLDGTGMAVQALGVREPLDGRRILGELRGAILDHVLPAHEVARAEGRAEARRAAGGQRVVGTGEVVAHR